MLKNFVSMLAGTTIGIETAKIAGGIGGGIGKATQTLVSAGTLGFVAGKAKDMWKWK